MTYKFIRYLFAILFCSMAFIAQADIEKARDLMEANNFKEAMLQLIPVSYTHLTLPTTPYV